MPWRYEPADNRTPVNHPLIGHLEWGAVYDNPLCANDPRFVEIDAPADPDTTDTDPDAAGNATGGDISADAESANAPAAKKRAGAGKTGRS